MLGFPSDPPKTPFRQMRAGLHGSQYRSEPLEVEAFRSSQRMFFEERHHSPEQILTTLHGEAQENLPMVERTKAFDHTATPELLVEELQCRPRGRRLGHRELALDLPAETATPVAHYRDRKAAFTVDEADDPLLNTWPFLLIARTGRIVTAHTPTLQTG